MQAVPNPDSLNTIDLEYLPQQKLEGALAREYTQPDSVLAAHSWITPQIRWNKPPVRDNSLSNLVAFPRQLRPLLHAVPDNFGEAVRSEFLKLSYVRSGNDEDIFRELNKQAGVKPTPQPDVFVLVPSSINQLFELQISKNTEFAREFSCLMPTGIQGEHLRYIAAVRMLLMRPRRLHLAQRKRVRCVQPDQPSLQAPDVNYIVALHTFRRAPSSLRRQSSRVFRVRFGNCCGSTAHAGGAADVRRPCEHR